MRRRGCYEHQNTSSSCFGKIGNWKEGIVKRCTTLSSNGTPRDMDESLVRDVHFAPGDNAASFAVEVDSGKNSMVPNRE